MHGAPASVIGHPSRSDGGLDTFRGGLTDQQVMLAAQVIHDSFVHPVTTDTYRSSIHNVTQRQHRDFGCPAPDIDDHITCWIRNRHARTNCRGNRFGDQTRAARSSGQDGLPDRPFLNGGRAMWDADNDLGFGEGRPLRDLADEVLNHLLCSVEVCNDPIAHWANGLDAARRPAKHHLGVFTSGQNLLLTVFYMVGYHRRFRQDHTLALDVHQCVRRT